MRDTMLGLLTASEGRALVLCTAHKAMKAWADWIKAKVPWPVLLQGELPRAALLRRFAEEGSSILFATRSFWQGVAIPGDSLSLLIVDKLPFEGPDDPLFDARAKACDRRQPRSSFSALFLPVMTLTLRQGAGRLIRRETDRGVIAILDGRVE